MLLQQSINCGSVTCLRPQLTFTGILWYSTMSRSRQIAEIRYVQYCDVCNTQACWTLARLRWCSRKFLTPWTR